MERNHKLTITIGASATRETLRISQRVRHIHQNICHHHNSTETDSSTADIISTVEFDQTGNYLATGDKGGRVVLFERNETVGFLQLDLLAAINVTDE